MDTITAKAAWDECLEVIQDNISYQKYKSWFEPIKPVKLNNNTLTIQVPSQFWYEWLEEHYYNMLRSTIAKVLGKEGKLEYSVLVERSERIEDNVNVDGKLYKDLPRIFVNLFSNIPIIKEIILETDIEEINHFWEIETTNDTKLNDWARLVDNYSKSIGELKDLDLSNMILSSF